MASSPFSVQRDMTEIYTLAKNFQSFKQLNTYLDKSDNRFLTSTSKEQ